MIVKRFSRNRVTYPPTPRTKDELQRVVRPMIVEELTPSAYPTSGQLNTRNLPPAKPLPDPNIFVHITRARANAMRKAQRANAESSVTPNLSPRDAQAETPQKYVIDRIINCGINDDKEQPYAKVRERIHRVQWYGFQPSDDAFEPI